MEKPFNPSEPIADGPLAEIPMIFQTGQIPDELLPKTVEDRAAISALQARVWPIDDKLVSSNAQRLERRLPIQNLCVLLASHILPFIRKAYRKAAGDQSHFQRDPKSELRAVSSFVQFALQVENPEYRADRRIYEMLSHQQLWLIHIWPNNAQGEVPITGELILKWLDGTFLLVALMSSAYAWLEWASLPDWPKKALEWLLGYEPCHDWYLVWELKRATQKSNKSLMACLTKWARLPDVAREDTPHYSGSNPEDRRMLYLAGEASLTRGWEEFPDPRGWIRTVAWRLRAAHKREDEAEHIAAHAHKIVLVSQEEWEKEPDKCEKERAGSNRLDKAINTPEERRMHLATPVNDPFAALLPSSNASVEDIHAALDWQKHCRAMGLSEDAVRLGLAKFALAKKEPGKNGRMKPLGRQRLAALLDLDGARLKAKEQELRRARPALMERLSAYGLGIDK
jgi:hypothetical protein